MEQYRSKALYHYYCQKTHEYFGRFQIFHKSYFYKYISEVKSAFFYKSCRLSNTVQSLHSLQKERKKKREMLQQAHLNYYVNLKKRSIYYILHSLFGDENEENEVSGSTDKTVTIETYQKQQKRQYYYWKTFMRYYLNQWKSSVKEGWKQRKEENDAVQQEIFMKWRFEDLKEKGKQRKEKEGGLSRAATTSETSHASIPPSFLPSTKHNDLFNSRFYQIPLSDPLIQPNLARAPPRRRDDLYQLNSSGTSSASFIKIPQCETYRLARTNPRDHSCHPSVGLPLSSPSVPSFFSSFPAGSADFSAVNQQSEVETVDEINNIEALVQELIEKYNKIPKTKENQQILFEIKEFIDERAR
jgi:hypothetical protein